MQKHHLTSLTWLRAFAAFFVVVSHTVRTSEVRYAPGDEQSYFLPVAFMDLGTFGVYLFFALSGCTLYLSNSSKLNSVSYFGEFFVKRFFRIWPAFAFSMLVYLVFIEVFRKFYIADPALWIGHFLREYTVANIFQYLSLTFNLTGPSGLFQDPYWSLPVEFQYYLLLPFAVFLMRTNLRSFLVPVLFGCVLYFIYREHLLAVDRDEIFKMGFTFFGGVLLAHFYQNKQFRLPTVYSVSCFFLVTLLVGLVRTNLLTLPASIPVLLDKWDFYGICAIVSVFLALHMKPFNSKNIITSILTDYGEVSYSIYLFHMLFIGISVLFVVNFHIYGDTPKLFFILAVSLIGSYLFSRVTYKYIELPSIKLGRRFSRSSRPIQQTAEAAAD